MQASRRSSLPLRHICLMVCATAVLLATSVSASDDSQRPGADSTNPVVIPGVVVQADRIPMTAWELPQAVTTIDRQTQNVSLHRSLGEFLNGVSGIRAYPGGNSWGQSVVDVRGFYGGGQAQYILVTLDGVPVNDISSGLVNWSAVSLAEVDHAEVLRGPVSAQYGDFGFGGMVSLYSLADRTGTTTRFSLLGGPDNAYGGDLSISKALPDFRLRGTGSVKSSDGWREHSQFDETAVSFGFTRPRSSRLFLDGSVAFGHSEEQIPGALTAGDLESDRAGAGTDLTGEPIRNRHKVDQLLAGLTADYTLGPALALFTKIHVNTSSADDIVTTTQVMSHTPDVFSAGGELGLNVAGKLGHRDARFTAGAAVNYGRLSTRYTTEASPGIVDVISDGSGSRVVVSGFTKAVYYITDPLILSLGLRADYVSTDFTWDEGVAVSPGENLSTDAFHMSPSLGLNFAFNPHLTCFLSAAGAFKTPTLTHLYDSAPFGMFDPGSNTFNYMLISNDQLDPMSGIHLEVGARVADYHGFDATVNYFNYWIDNEIDFSDATLSYVNIGESHHTGVELGVNGTLLKTVSIETSLGYNEATIRGSDLDGNQLNGVPTWSYRSGLWYHRDGIISIGTVVSGIADQYLDEGNTQMLGDYATVSVHGKMTVSAVELSVRLDNLLDREYEYDGYLDPLLRGAARYYPASGRQLTVSLSGSI